MKVIRRFLAAIGLAVLSLRYRIRTDKKELFKKSEGRGVVFLPNHPAEIDPLILNALLFSRFRPRPLVIEHFYYLRGMRFFMRLVSALPLPNFETSANQWKVREVEKCLEKVKKGLEQGDNFLIYPSGQLKQEGHEVIGGSSFIERLLATCPDLKLVLVRTTGLWGSLFSRAITGESPNFWQVLARGYVALLKSGIFFLPRRKVNVTFAVAPDDFPRKGSRREINRYLENWYNRYESEKGEQLAAEPLKLISLSCWSATSLPVVTAQKSLTEGKSEVKIPKAVRTTVIGKLASLSGYKVKDLKETHHLSRDLGLDSLDIAELQAFLDEQFEIERFVPEKLQTVEAILKLAATGEAAHHVELPPFEWPEEKERGEVKSPEGTTIQEAFLRVTKRMGSAVACADSLFGTLTYNKLRLATLALEQVLKKLPGHYIGVLLPSSASGYIVILALLLAGKTPVMLNWTMGARNLTFAFDLLELQTVLTARRFLERLDVLELGALEDHLVLMEDVRTKITLWHRLKAYLQKGRKTTALLRSLKLDQVTPDDQAALLFTSGTETRPKAVPLSHANLLENQKAIFKTTKLNRTDLLYGVLPPFHSFGFSVTGLFPLLIGLKVFYAPDPTDSKAMARDLARCCVTIMCCAPSFYRQLFKVAKRADLKKVRLFISGAEKATPDLFDFVASLNSSSILLEGYGITECSPVVTINKEGKKPTGVGRPPSGVELCLIHPETRQKITGESLSGEVCIRGPNVFSGYLGGGVLDPFIEIDGKKWYRSGDLGSIDSTGALHLLGRLKRFVKIGGEMISLMALEEEITHFAKKENRIAAEETAPQLAIGIKEVSEKSKPELILFATFPIKREEVNALLKQAGFGRIVKIAAVKQIDAIPMTGSGKVQDRRIREMSAKFSP